MSAKKLILIAAIGTSLSGCATTVDAEFPKPKLPSSVAKGCPAIPYIDGKEYKKLGSGHKRVYKDALKNNIRCRQSNEWIIRLNGAWPGG
jgi:hypothetical protein